MVEDLSNSVRTLRQLGVVPGVATALRATAPEFSAELFRITVEDVDAFTMSANPDIAPELQQHLRQLVENICDTLTEVSVGNLDYVRRYARRCAEQKFPLDALLLGATSAHRLTAPWVRDAALTAATESVQVRRVVAATSEFLSGYFSRLSSLMTSEYVQRTRTLAEDEGDRRTELFNLLLRGYDESDSHAAHLLRRAGYLEQRQSFCVVAARSVEPGEMENRARAQRMADAVSATLVDLPVRSLVGIRDDLVTIVLSGKRRQSGWTAPQSRLAERIYPQLRQVGPAALIGISADAPSTTHIPRAVDEARLALDFATVAERVMPFSKIPFRRLLVYRARDDIQHALPAWLGAFTIGNRKSRGTLLHTLSAYADADMNVLRTAQVLSVHPNTIYARLQKVEDLTGRNALGYNALTELLLVAECAGIAT